MSDQAIANIARQLAEALARHGHSRSVDDQKAVAALQTELVREVRQELQDDPTARHT